MTHTEPRVDDFRAVGERLRNWGRWGPDDERGTINLITPERLVAAGRLIRAGRTFDLGINLDDKGPQNGRFRSNPVHLMSETGAEQVFPGGFRYADDFLFMPIQASSQWDALAHVFYDGQFYNGFPADELTVKGAGRCGIDRQGKGIAGRGVLLDIPAVRGVPWLEAGDVITPADLDAAITRQGGVDVGPGDILLVRTGWRRKFVEQGQDAGFMAGEPGLGLASCQWLRDRDVAAVCADNWAVEALPGEDPGAFLAVHMVLIRDMGLTLGEILDFEELTEDCRADGVWEFFFAAPPLKITRAVGSPINPLAIK
ncbi:MULTISPECIES: cyclase family protein [Micromonospora]|uniref:cyclase family protein n=1 Tax=Micromonospora TaxID=1873 RepID=UPI001EE95AEE|nr:MULTISPECIES: cyclase family protein [Micromonospora]MCG5449729.1 cyclase family protein [Micromonospora hortensis]MCX5121875.1 cyclase family protein [Micromonospora sp. NBC_00362]